MSVAEILKVLSQLDVKNDEHWTADGAPRLDVVQKMLPGVTREMLVRAGGRFSRSNPKVRDLEEERVQAQERLNEAQRKAQEAKEAEQEARESLQEVEVLCQQQRDSHSLTRQNQTWLAAQTLVDAQRHQRGKAIDALIADAGGLKNIGKYPIEVNTAARVKAARREQQKNFVAKPQ